MNNYVMPINRAPKRQFVIGIDPDKNESGFAVWDRQLNKFIRHECLFFSALQEACFSYEKETCVIYLEAGWLNKGANKYQAETRPKGFNTWSAIRREAYIFGRGCDVGINFGAGWSITHVLRANDYLLHHYCPNTPKWDAEWLRKITGITAPTNQDTRDGIRAAYLNR